MLIATGFERLGLSAGRSWAAVDVVAARLIAIGARIRDDVAVHDVTLGIDRGCRDVTRSCTERATDHTANCGTHGSTEASACDGTDRRASTCSGGGADGMCVTIFDSRVGDPTVFRLEGVVPFQRIFGVHEVAS